MARKCPECLEEFLGDEPEDARMCSACQEHYDNDEAQWANELAELEDEENDENS